MMPQITVVICTHNRASYLQQALESLAHQSLPQAQFEVFVVDNGSTDPTAKVAQSYATNLSLRYFYEPKLGLSVARNRGLAECASTYITYLDDDAIASDYLLEAILDGFQMFCPQPVLVGGKVLLNWNGDLPSWLPAQHLSLYSLLDYGDRPRFLNDKEYIVGANFSARTAFLREICGFQPTLGRRGGMLLSGEETKVVREAHNLGFPILYQPKALVWHTVTPDRKKISWLRKRLFWDGASQPMLDYGPGLLRSYYLKQTLYDLRRLTHFGLEALMGHYEASYQFLQRAGRLRTNLMLLVQPTQKVS